MAGTESRPRAATARRATAARPPSLRTTRILHASIPSVWPDRIQLEAVVRDGEAEEHGAIQVFEGAERFRA